MLRRNFLPECQLQGGAGMLTSFGSASIRILWSQPFLEGVIKNTSISKSTLLKKHNAINYHSFQEAAAAGILYVGKEDGSTNLSNLLVKVIKLHLGCITSHKMSGDHKHGVVGCGLRWGKTGTEEEHTSVYPIAQMKDYWHVVKLICQCIPREVLNVRYSIKLPVPSVHELKERGITKGDVDSGTALVLPLPTTEELLGTYCVICGMLAAASGVPVYQNASCISIKEYVDGKLLFCHPPPNLTTAVDNM
eukprot:6441911-Ditylum_brightwellii.AAC.1